MAEIITRENAEDYLNQLRHNLREAIVSRTGRYEQQLRDYETAVARAEELGVGNIILKIHRAVIRGIKEAEGLVSQLTI